MDDVGTLKQIPGRQYDQALCRWIIPHDQKMITRLIEHYRERGAKIVDRTILSTSEVDRMLRMTQNKKYLAILYALYGSGMRLGELLNLEVPDILWDRNQIHVRKGKGNKDRMVMFESNAQNLK